VTKTNELKEDIHQINGLIGRMGFSIDELQDLEASNESIPKETIEDLALSFEELKKMWKTLSSKL